jgi:hypothetical protein
MIRNMEKHVAISEFHALKSDSAGARIVILLDVLIDELRKENDTISLDRLERNQGKIEAFSQLKDYLERGLPKQR